MLPKDLRQQFEFSIFTKSFHHSGLLVSAGVCPAASALLLFKADLQMVKVLKKADNIVCVYSGICAEHLCH